MNRVASRLSIAVARGDGIGPEIMNASLRVFEAARVPLNYEFVEMGKDIYKRGISAGMTPQAQETVERLGILYKGPMETPKGTGVKSINVTARKVWNAFANKRVFQTYPGVETVFAKANIPIDLTLVRENIEDTYGGIEHMQTHDVAQCRRLITRPGCEQVHRYAFDTARRKRARRLTCAHKANIMKITDGLFLETFRQIAKEYPDVKTDDIIIDDLAMKLVAVPDKFDMIVLPNLQGDILSDLCAGLVGGLGMAPSANIGDRISIFEAVHGTAPDIVGKGVANPCALLMSGAMMLRHLGLEEHNLGIHQALMDTLRAGERTVDLTPPGKSYLTTEAFTEAIIRRLPATLTSAQFQVPANITFQPQPKPQHHIVHVSARNEPEKHMGIDLFLDSGLRPPQLAEKVQALLPKDYKLTMLSNRGTQVWPTTSLFTECINTYRARIEILEPALSQTNHTSGDLLKLASEVAREIRVCSVEMLLKIGDKKGYTLAQGQ